MCRDSPAALSLGLARMWLTSCKCPSWGRLGDYTAQCSPQRSEARTQHTAGRFACLSHQITSDFQTRKEGRPSPKNLRSTPFIPSLYFRSPSSPLDHCGVLFSRLPTILAHVIALPKQKSVHENRGGLSCGTCRICSGGEFPDPCVPNLVSDQTSCCLTTDTQFYRTQILWRNVHYPTGCTNMSYMTWMPPYYMAWRHSRKRKSCRRKLIAYPNFTVRFRNVASSFQFSPLLRRHSCDVSLSAPRCFIIL